MAKEILSHFNEKVLDYDLVASKVIFRYNELHENLLDSIPFDLDKKIKVLDIWCGTWYSMDLILKKYKNCEIIWVDFSDRMIEIAKNKLKKYSNSINFLNHDISSRDFKIVGKYDLIISVITIHNISNSEKKKLFKKIYNSLNEGWIFINADFFKHEVKELDKKMHDVFREYLEKNLEWEELQIWLNHIFKEDIPMKLSKQFKILEKKWFKNVSLNWMFNNEAIYIAKR